MFYKNRILIKKPEEKVQSECPVCGYLARDLDDMISIEKEKACTECCINFTHVMGDRWAKGERPTQKVARSRMSILIDEV
tara:strand:- start:1040 stop:1279 length:240 start_codon:yes stop_codon:yes gene_type:complete